MYITKKLQLRRFRRSLLHPSPFIMLALDDYQGKGYTTEAVGGLLSWAFEQPQVMSVIAETFPNNAASIRVMEKNGMVLLGNGNEEGTVRYGIVRS
ncbi:MAG: GNAT family N-acetyltransferase [Stigonema ocellatum SAG 48.90 = DSM 106950]|nr:GNAT family N-acetyltransferase [Stigonema ocellatum SAG 48.90 = DSM 106950]